MGSKTDAARLQLSGSTLFKDASSVLARSLIGAARPVSLSEGEILFSQGDHGRSLFILETGRLDVSILSRDGRKLTLNALRPGEVFGEIAIFDGGPRTATVAALAPSTVLEIRKSDLERGIREEPELAIELLELAGRRLRWLESLVEDRAFQKLEVRLARRILHLLAKDADSGTLEFSQADLADHVGATRVAVSNIIAVWRNHGIVKPGRGSLTVLSRTRLRAIADEERF